MLLCLIAILFSVPAALCDEPVVVRSFISRPDILAPKLNIRTYEAETVTPGYIFLSTWGDEGAQNAPYTFDSSGELVWSGHDASIPSMKYFNTQVHHLHNGSSLLSVFRGPSEKGRGRGHIALLDSSYRTAATITSPGRPLPLDFHEFKLSDDGQTAIVVMFQLIQADLRQFGVREGMGWLLDSCFLQLNLQTGETLFEWCASKHIPLNESILAPSMHRAAALSFNNAFDYFHINSVDLAANGNYLISARHTDTIYCLDASDGSVKWRLGGANSSFEMIGFNFSAQHDAQILGERTTSRVLISSFNNAFNGEDATAETSSAMVVELDFANMSTSLVQKLYPSHGGLAQNQGSVQNLPSNHTLVSWGMIAEFTEFDNEGIVVLDVAFEDIVTHTYRVRKGNWTGTPDSKPDLYIYARNTSTHAHFWMSWNGATEVKAWRVFSSHGEDGTEPVALGTIEKAGFETRFEADRFVRAGFIEAVDHKGRVLGRSELRQVVVPTDELQRVCGERHCTLQILPAREDEADVVFQPHVVEAARIGGMTWSTTLLQWITIFGLGLMAGKMDGLALLLRLLR